MYIKQIIIQGFKSYREQTVTEPFDPRHNVVVGRNGSGKSNFFQAIQFVLSDEFSHLRPEQRQALLHEGTGPRVITAFVEIIFDNSDQRLPIDKDEVFIRRVIGSKKDQYFLNKKMVTRTDIMNLLESAGFSRSNPYYIVKQGKINQMATAPDSHRLKLLREVAGTRVYDERREESMVILRETEGKRDKIEEFLKTIMDRLSTLEEEKEELKEYQKWDKTRRSLEYTIHDRELKDTRTKLEQMETQRKDSGSEQEKMREQLVEAGDQAKVAAKEVRECKSKLTAAKEERDQFNTEYQQLLKDKTKLEFQIKDLVDEVSGDNKSKERAEKELAKLKETIALKEEEFQKLKPQYEELKRKEEECTRELALKEQKRKELYAKQGRGNQFTTREERDTWIRKELKSLNKAIRDKKEQIERLTEDLKNDGEKMVQLEQNIQQVTSDMETHRSSIDDHNKGYYDMKKKKDSLQAERNDLWRQENKLQQEVATLKEDMAKAEQSLRSMVGKPVLNGRDSVLKVLEFFKSRSGGGQWARLPDQYFGLVIENFDCDKSIYTAVEVTAGNRLFFHIVESDQVGTQILKEMNRQKLPGEANFMPLNKLLVKEIDYPQTQDALPMVSKLNFDDKFSKAFIYIFGRTLICRNLEVATNLARSTRLDCVTLDGDQVSSKGSLTGGYFNKSRSRLEIQKSRSDLMNQVKEAEENLSALRGKLSGVESSINQIVSDMQKTETKNSKAKDFFDRMKADIRLMREELNAIERSKNPKERSLNQLKASLEGMQTTQEGLESELHQELLPSLSAADQREVDKLNDDIRTLTQANKEAFAHRMKLEAEKNKLENLLSNNLNRRKDELVLALQEISVEDRKQQLDNCNSELKTVEASVESVQSQLKALDKKLQDLSKKHKSAQTELDKWKSREKEILGRMEADARDLEKMASKQTLYQDKISECTQKIRDLGSLPSEAFTKYQNLTTKQLFKQLEKANTELKKYGHVNKKALDQFVSFSEQKETLLARKDELDRAHESIQQLMQTLEQRKYEAIQFTYKQVSKYFGEVFKQLVPAGSGQLVMRTASKKDKDDEEDNEESFDNFTGVGIRVSFVGTRGEMREMNQLSGGQKSLVALALIFAIQKCDPAPFYLFDEIDQALDAQHRKAVAEMIHELSKNAQFITTTFRPELLESARKFYGVKFRNKVSHVECVSKEEAADFVEDDAQHA
ncbi:unnamed protein product [Notodromas monacha]|uniref:Structural maintenance of chromosomes protein n=1 Tax=Notodromas monacha TaxID=399045 RepID=A0A7R9BPN1_9CRUS|nr:unnamed protein product [Notodromas monacha]CAG0919332.1 unnamed protein product [Notodromas monacha]